jgi:arylformamidase
MIASLADGTRFDTADPIDISISLQFNGPQPNAYGVEPASSAAYEYGELVGDTRRGGSCNFERYTLIPHCNGTHTECVGHITRERISVRERSRQSLVAARLISVEPILARDCGERFSVEPGATDKAITGGMLRASLSDTAVADDISRGALVIRTLPNDNGKLTRRYDGSFIPPYFSLDAMEFIVGLGYEHLLVDLPSIDRLFDQGRLANHRIFWNMDEGSLEENAATRGQSTITELIYVPVPVLDGRYVLNLQIAPFEADAAPSRPLLFPIVQE